MPVNYVELDRALHGNQAPENLDADTRAEYDAIVAQGPVQRVEPTEADLAAEQFWAEVNECAAAVHAVGEQHGHGSAQQDQFIVDLRALGGEEPAN